MIHRENARALCRQRMRGDDVDAPVERRDDQLYDALQDVAERAHGRMFSYP